MVNLHMTNLLAKGGGYRGDLCPDTLSFKTTVEPQSYEPLGK